MKNWAKNGLWLAGFIAVYGCAMPDPYDPNASNTVTKQGVVNECSPGATGPDSDSDGVIDACETAMTTPPNDPDCDKDGIPDSRDNPKDCNPNANPDECDAYCQENQRRMWAELADSMALGGSSVGGVAYPGVNVLIKKKVFAFANSKGVLDVDGATKSIGASASQRLSSARCNNSERKSNFYLFSYGDVSYDSFDGLDGQTVPPGGAKNVNYEMCGTLKEYNPATGTLTGTSATLTLNYVAGVLGEYSARALDVSNSAATTTVEFTKTESFSHSTSCPSTSDVFKKISAKFTPNANEYTLQYKNPANPAETLEIQGTFSTNPALEDWERPGMGNCDLVNTFNLGAGGFWVKDSFLP